MSHERRGMPAPDLGLPGEGQVGKSLLSCVPRSSPADGRPGRARRPLRAEARVTTASGGGVRSAPRRTRPLRPRPAPRGGAAPGTRSAPRSRRAGAWSCRRRRARGRSRCTRRFLPLALLGVLHLAEASRANAIQTLVGVDQPVETAVSDAELALVHQRERRPCHSNPIFRGARRRPPERPTSHLPPGITRVGGVRRPRGPGRGGTSPLRPRRPSWSSRRRPGPAHGRCRSPSA